MDIRQDYRSCNKYRHVYRRSDCTPNLGASLTCNCTGDHRSQEKVRRGSRVSVCISREGRCDEVSHLSTLTFDECRLAVLCTEWEIRDAIPRIASDSNLWWAGFASLDASASSLLSSYTTLVARDVEKQIWHDRHH